MEQPISQETLLCEALEFCNKNKDVLDIMLEFEYGTHYKLHYSYKEINITVMDQICAIKNRTNQYLVFSCYSTVDLKLYNERLKIYNEQGDGIDIIWSNL